MADGHARARADRIRESIPIVQVLEDYGYRVRGDGGEREQQFSCNLHGTGWDTKPSARVYPESNSWYCFACDVSRDAIGTVQANEGLEFWGAIKWLEGKYKLPPMKWEGPTEVSTLDSVAASLRYDKTFDDDRERLTARLNRLTTDRDLTLPVLLSFWEAHDKVVFQVKGPKGRGGPWSEKQGRVVIAKLQERLLKAMRGSE
jgi:hypothetical protein